jgi:hypothetical protein
MKHLFLRLVLIVVSLQLGVGQDLAAAQPISHFPENDTGANEIGIQGKAATAGAVCSPPLGKVGGSFSSATVGDDGGNFNRYVVLSFDTNAWTLGNDYTLLVEKRSGLGTPFVGLGSGVTLEYLLSGTQMPSRFSNPADVESTYTSLMGSISEATLFAASGISLTNTISSVLRTAGPRYLYLRFRFPICNDGDGAADNVVFYSGGPAGEGRATRIVESPVTMTVASTSPRIYAGIAFPLNPDDAGIASILVPQLGLPDDRVWRLGHWDPATEKYLEAKNGDLSTVTPGEGYWLITKDAKSIQMTGSRNAGANFSRDLSNGTGTPPAWNQLGNPYAFDVPLSSALVNSWSGPLPDPPVQLTTQGVGALTSTNVWLYNSATGAYTSNSTVIPASSMFWLQKISTGRVTLTIPRPAGSPSPSFETNAGREVSLWEVSVKAHQSDRMTTELVLGAANVRTGEWNPLSVALPPSPPGLQLRLASPQPGWGPRRGYYSSVFLPIADRMVWDLVIEGGAIPGEVALNFHFQNVPSEYLLRLRDDARDLEWAVESGGTIMIAATTSPRRLQLVATHSATVADSPSPVRFSVYPNPASEASGLVFRLPFDAEVRAKIFDVNGRLVRELRRPLALRGENVLTWDGRDDRGRDAGSGIFFAQCSVGGQSGTVRIVRLR